MAGLLTTEGPRVPVLPLIDLLILLAWTFLVWAFVQKGLWLAFASAFTVLGLTPYDFVFGSALCLLFALALAARVWVKGHEPNLIHTLHRAGHGGTPTETLPDFPDPRQPAPQRASRR
jgi:hypothetical protein